MASSHTLLPLAVLLYDERDLSPESHQIQEQWRVGVSPLRQTDSPRRVKRSWTRNLENLATEENSQTKETPRTDVRVERVLQGDRAGEVGRETYSPWLLNSQNSDFI